MTSIPPVMKTFQHLLRASGFAALGLLLVAASATAQEHLEGLCARVKIEIEQELALERIGFEATLEVTNNDGEDPLTEFSARLFFMDPSKDPLDPEHDATSLFFVQPPTLENINRIDGNGVIGPTKKAVVRWFIIPKIDAGGTDPRGKQYLVSCELSANIRGTSVPDEALLVMPETITVVPDAQLDIVYFQPQYVTANDPFTPEIESPVPFTLGVLVRNRGYGPANRLTISSQQPRIVENIQGLLLVARLLGVRVMDEPLDETSLTVDLGDIPPGGTRKGAWDMITSLSGIFTDFKASYRHAPELGGEETSVITSIAAHFITGEVLNDEPGRDNILDFLADTNRDGMPDTLFESEGQELPVNLIEEVNPFPLSGNVMLVDIEATVEGWGYFRIDDPTEGRLVLREVVRDDGRILHPRNAWLEERYTPGRPRRDYYLHVFDRVELGPYQYTVTYEPPPVDTTPPVTRLRFSGEVNEADGIFYVTPETQMFFTAEDESPVSMFYKLDDGDFRPALPFTLRDPGVYLLTYYSEDAAGNIEEPKTATLALPAEGPLFEDVNLVSDGLFLRGETLSVRSGEVSLQTQVAASPMPVEATVSVFKGTRAFPVLGGVPPSPTSQTGATITVGGDQVDHYRYRLGGGAWSAERPVHESLVLDGLSGTVSLHVQGRPEMGAYPPEEEGVSAVWVVSPGAPAWTLSGAPTHPSRDTAVAFTVERDEADLYRWRLDESYLRAEEPLTTPVVIDRVETGARGVSFIGRVGGVWEENETASTYSWTVDPGYGSDFSGLSLVLAETFADVGGTTFTFNWDGRDAGGRLQSPGWYTVFVELSDPLGNRVFRSHIVNISDLAGEQRTLVAAAGSPRNPHGRGTRAVWQQRVDGAAWHIHALDMDAPGGTPLVLTSGNLSQENPRTDGRYVVWQARRADGTWDIRMADLEDPAAITDITQTPGRNEVNPAVSWPWVVYQVRSIDEPGAPWQLEAFNIVTGERDLVYPGQDDQVNPAVDAGRVAWRDLRDPGNGEIYVQNLETGETMRLTNDLFGQFFPDIRGDWVVWQDNREGQVEIFAYNLHEGREVRLTDGVGNKARPFIEGNWVLYEEDSFAFETNNLHLLDIESRRSVPLTYDPANKSRAALVAGQVLWQEGTGEPFALRIAALPALQAVFHRSNAVAITAELAAQYGDAHSLLTEWNALAAVQAVRRYSAFLPQPVAEEAVWSGGQPTGDNFALEAGGFLWVEFPEIAVLDLGERSPVALDLQAGLNVFSYSGFPLDYTAYRMAADLGIDRTVAIRLLDASTGLWRSVEVDGTGDLLGPNFIVPPVAVVLIELREPVMGWVP